MPTFFDRDSVIDAVSLNPWRTAMIVEFLDVTEVTDADYPPVG